MTNAECVSVSGSPHQSLPNLQQENIKTKKISIFTGADLIGVIILLLVTLITVVCVLVIPFQDLEIVTADDINKLKQEVNETYQEWKSLESRVKIVSGKIGMCSLLWLLKTAFQLVLFDALGVLLCIILLLF